MKPSFFGSKPCCPVVFSFLLVLCLFWPPRPAGAQSVDVGDISPEFSITSRPGSHPIHLSDYAGQVLVLDFFAYWCGPCRESSPDLIRNVDQYYEQSQGNEHGVPVVVMSVNVEAQNSAATDAFIRGFGLPLVADDLTSGGPYSLFNDGFIPLFVIINGVADSPSHRQWEVLYRSSGYPGAPALRKLIDAVEPADPQAPARIRAQPQAAAVRAGQAHTFEVGVSGAAPLTYQWSKASVPIPGATNATLTLPALARGDAAEYTVIVSNPYGEETSVPAVLTVLTGGDVRTFTSPDLPLSLPDYPADPVGVTADVGLEARAYRVGVKLGITHTFVGDLYIYLIAPSGKYYLLKEGDSRDDRSALNLEIPDIRSFVGEPVQGRWVLSVYDDAEDDVGTLDSWTLTIETQSQGLTYSQWAANYPDLSLADPGSDPDGDGIPALLEFLIDGFSPRTTDRLPSLAVDVSDKRYLIMNVPLRRETVGASIAFDVASGLGVDAWQDAVNVGGNIVVESGAADFLRIKMRTDLGQGQFFIRLRGQVVQ